VRQTADENRLCRKEFFEVIIRVALLEFPSESLKEALSLTYQKMVSKSAPISEWQGFRDNHLWNNKCSELFQENLQGL